MQVSRTLPKSIIFISRRLKMAVAGHVHKITDHKKFFSAALLNDKKLMEKSSEPVGPVEVELITRFPLPPSVLSLPPISFSQDQSSTDGQFIFNHPELTPAMEKQATLQLVVRKLLFPPNSPPTLGGERRSRSSTHSTGQPNSNGATQTGNRPTFSSRWTLPRTIKQSRKTRSMGPSQAS